MDDVTPNPEWERAIAEWRARHRLAPDDPIVWVAELVELAARHGGGPGETASNADRKGFFKTQSQTHIAHALELLHELGRPVTLVGAYELLTDASALGRALEDLGELLQTPAREALTRHFVSRLLNQPAEQLGGVRETIANHLQHFLTPAIAEVFGPEEKSTFTLGALDRGGIVLVTMPQKYQTERRYVNTFLKLLFYNHALRRFDKPKAERARENLLILWADEAQRFMTASEDGTCRFGKLADWRILCGFGVWLRVRSAPSGPAVLRGLTPAGQRSGVNSSRTRPYPRRSREAIGPGLR